MSTTVLNPNSNLKSASSSLNGGSPSNKSITSSNKNNVINSNGNNVSNSQTITTARHWSQKKHESSISSETVEESNFLSKLRGGSDSGQFIYLDPSLATINSSLPMDLENNQHLIDSNLAIKLQSGKLLGGEILLEIQGIYFF